MLSGNGTHLTKETEGIKRSVRISGAAKFDKVYSFLQLEEEQVKYYEFLNDEIFDDIKKLTLNREQRRKMPKNMDNPDVLRDVVKGPVLVVIPIAVYQ